MTDLIAILGLSIFGSVVALVGGLVFLYARPFSKVLNDFSIPFAAGVLLTVSIIGLVPEAVHSIGEAAYMVVLLSFLAAFLFEHLVLGLHHHASEGHGKDYVSSATLVIVGDTIHNFVDGVAIAASFLVAPGLGLVTAISTFFHEVPHEIGDFGILLKAGWKKKSIIVVNLLSALVSILGALMVVFWTNDERVVGTLLAMAAGLFLYLGASDFLPHVHEGEKNQKKCVAALIVGVVVMITVLKIVPHAV